MAQFTVRCTTFEDVEDWPIVEAQFTIEADNEDEAEEIADKALGAIQENRGVKRAMGIDEVYES